jgi:hypothetical protein
MTPPPSDPSPPSELAKAQPAENAAAVVVPTSFVLEVVERANDRLLDRIDSLDAFFGVLMTAALAVILLALDRFRLVGLYPDVECGWIAIVFLTLAFFVAMIAWLRGNDTLLRKLFKYGDGREEELDAPIPQRFVWAVGTKGERALIDTIQAIDASFQRSYPIRTFKRNLASVALVLLVLGTITAAVAKVVYLRENDTTSQSGASRTGHQDRIGGSHSRRSVR